MALNILTQQNVDVVAAESPENALESQLFGEEYEKLFRPSLADRLQIGLLRSDHATQTAESEIPEIKGLTSTVQELVFEMENLKRDFHFSKQAIKAKYNSDLENASHDFHVRLQEKISDIEQVHEERVDVIRRSFKQQLQDAVVKMSSKYKKYYEDKLAGKLKPTTPSGDRKSKIANLEAELQRCQSIIEMLEIQTENLRAELESRPAVTEIVMDTAELDAALAQNDALQAEILELSNRIDDLNDAVEFREDKIRELKSQLSDSKEQTEKEREMTRKLAKKIEDLKNESEKNQEMWKRDVEKMKASLQEEMAGEMQKQMESQKELLMNQQKVAAEAELEQQRVLEEERNRYERLLSKERENVERARREAQGNRSFETLLEQQKSEVSILKSRLARTQKQWEKKFSVLRASMHALKDESYIRQQLQKQSATLKYASISYGTDVVPSYHPAPPATGILNPNKPLPSIRGEPDQHHHAVTTTLPSGPGTEVFAAGVTDSADEHEMEEYAEGFMPLPSPPHWQKQQFGEYMPSIDQNNATYS